MLVINEKTVTKIFAGLSPKGVLKYQESLIKGLLEYQSDNSIIPPRIVSTTPYCTHLFMASTGSRVGMKAITGSKEGFKGITTILDKNNGYPLGIINCTTLTAFRTALCNTLPLVKYYPINETYSNNETLIAFGVGDQAIWHIRLSLILYPKRFKTVIISNRTVSKAEKLCESFRIEYPNVEFKSLGLYSGENDNPLLEHFKTATVVFTCIPTSVPTVSIDLINKCEKSCFIGAIGSYKPHMTEIDGEVLFKHVIDKGGKIIVDSKEHCLHEAGEFIINKVQEDKLIDIATLYSDESSIKELRKQKIVISKLVGLCIMDVWVGSECLESAKRDGLGIEIEDF